MIKGADDLLHNHNSQLLKKFKDNDWKLENDPRITPFGKVLRSLTIDEFPQLLNVLKGEMSMVGPRAYRNDLAGNEIEEQLALYPKLRKQIDMVLTVKPGLTGPWQTSGRNMLPWDRRVELDAEYAKRKSLLYDMWIILKTPFAMINKW